MKGLRILSPLRLPISPLVPVVSGPYRLLLALEGRDWVGISDAISTLHRSTNPQHQRSNTMKTTTRNVASSFAVGSTVHAARTLTSEVLARGGGDTGQSCEFARKGDVGRVEDVFPETHSVMVSFKGAPHAMEVDERDVRVGS
jgi:hypothetical protein